MAGSLCMRQRWEDTEGGGKRTRKSDARGEGKEREGDGEGGKKRKDTYLIFGLPNSHSPPLLSSSSPSFSPSSLPLTTDTFADINAITQEEATVLRWAKKRTKGL